MSGMKRSCTQQGRDFGKEMYAWCVCMCMWWSTTHQSLDVGEDLAEGVGKGHEVPAALRERVSLHHQRCHTRHPTQLLQLRHRAQLANTTRKRKKRTSNGMKVVAGRDVIECLTDLVV